MVVLSDYQKGALQGIEDLIGARPAPPANRCWWTPKGRDFSRYQGATLLTPNLAEFEAVVGPCRTEAG